MFSQWKDLPFKLRGILAEALYSVQQHPTHDLTWGYRQEIYRAMGPIGNIDASSIFYAIPRMELLDQVVAEAARQRGLAADRVDDSIPAISDYYEPGYPEVTVEGWTPGQAIQDGRLSPMEASDVAVRPHTWENRGWLRRINLSLAAAEKTLPIWRSRLPNNMHPEVALYVAKLFLNGAITWKVAWSFSVLLKDYTWLLDPDSMEYNSSATYFAAWSAVKALRVAVIDQYWNSVLIDCDSTDVEEGPKVNDAASCASAAFAGGGLYYPDGSSDARRQEFWQWWLQYAVPTAWTSVANDLEIDETRRK